MYQFIKDVKPVDWWVSQADRVHPETVSVAKQLLTATSSSAGVQRESNINAAQQQVAVNDTATFTFTAFIAIPK